MSDWISVEDKMPEEDVPVLALNTFNGLDRSFCEVVYFQELDPIGTGLDDWVWFGRESGRWVRRAFTYWMPLPDPPE